MHKPKKAVVRTTHRSFHAGRNAVFFGATAQPTGRGEERRPHASILGGAQRDDGAEQQGD